jgi:hypothetical protein
VLTVGKDGDGVERRLSGGGLACPGCGGRLRPWGHARVRVVRDVGEVRQRLRPRRARCAGCGVTHVLLPVDVLVRRADVVTVIGAALARAAQGWGHRRIAVWLGRSAATVRGWLRRFRMRAEPLRDAFTALLCTVDADPVLPAPAGSAVADAVAAIVAAAGAVSRRWPVPGTVAQVFTVSPWLVASAVTSGRLLMPLSTVEFVNTGRLW